jgi:hypothetical protein
VMTLAARSIGISAWSTSTWGRWDSGLYLSIARDGYVFERCVDVANRGPEDWCGNPGWFPAYPWLMRFGSWLGFGYDTFGRIVSLVAMVGAWVVFPANVYYGAVFPISSMLIAVLLALWCLDRRRWLLAGLCGAAAATMYTSGLLVGAIALVPLLSATCAVGFERRSLSAVRSRLRT